MVDLDLTETEVGDYHVLSVGGEIDVYTAPTLRDKVDEVLDRDIDVLAIDLANVAFLDSTGLGVLVGAMKRLIAKDGRFAVVCNKPHILKVFEITGLTNVFDIHANLDDLPGCHDAKS